MFTGTGWVFEPLPAPEGAGNGESHIQWPRYVPVGTLRPEAESPICARACALGTPEGRGPGAHLGGGREDLLPPMWWVSRTYCLSLMEELGW